MSTPTPELDTERFGWASNDVVFHRKPTSKAMDFAWKFNPYHDETGRFTSGDFGGFGGGGGTGAGGETHPETMRMLLDSLSEDTITEVEPDSVGAFLHEAADVEEHHNLERLQVKGNENRNLYAEHLTNYSREEMPQLPTDAEGMQRYSDFMAGEGFEAEEDYVDPRDLKASQKELDSKKVGGIYRALQQSGEIEAGTLIVSEENGVIDGHHRWAAFAAHAVDHPETKVRVIRIKAPVEKVLEASRRFSEREGIAARKFGQRGLSWRWKANKGKFGERPTLPAPDPKKPYIWFNGKWHLILQDSEPDDFIALKDFYTDDEGVVHPVGEGEGGGGSSDPNSPGNKLSDYTVSSWTTGSMRGIRKDSERIMQSGKPPSKAPEYMREAKELMEAVDKSGVQQTLYRGLSLSDKQISDLLDSGEVKFGLSSFSKSRDMAGDWAERVAENLNGRPVVLHLSDARGADISNHNLVKEYGFQHQKEVVTYGRFKITGSETKGNVTHIHISGTR